MHDCRSIKRNSLYPVTEHIDAASRHAARDAEEYANGYRHTRKYLGYGEDTSPKTLLDRMGRRDWLAECGPVMRIEDASGKRYSKASYRSWIKQTARDRYGRSRTLVAYRGIFNPINEVQILYFFVSRHDPQRLIRLVKATVRYLERRLHRAFGPGPVQVAAHIKTGRLHFEWTVPTYNAQRVKARPGVRWYSKGISIAYAQSWAQGAKIEDCRLNTQIEVDYSRDLYHSIRRLVQRGRLPERDPLLRHRAKELFEELQFASLQDGTMSKRPRRRKRAMSLLHIRRKERVEKAAEALLANEKSVKQGFVRQA